MSIILNMNTLALILVLVPFFVLFVYVFLTDCNKLENTIEGWTNYQQNPLGNWYTGFDPLQFYNVPRFRHPYRYPVCHIKDYPVKHCAHLD